MFFRMVNKKVYIYVVDSYKFSYLHDISSESLKTKFKKSCGGLEEKKNSFYILKFDPIF